MNREQVRSRIEEIGIIPAIRVSSPEDARFAADAVCNHGIPIVEVTMTVPGAISVISELAAKHSLSVYDAAYLELARRKSLPLGSRDEQLREAARKAGVRLR